MGYERYYAVSNDGKVARIGKGRGSVHGRERKTYHGPSGLSVNLWKNNRSHYELVHVMVARAFIGDIPEGHEVRHKNGDMRDNRVENLEIVPTRDGADGPGLNPKNKLTASQVREIRRRAADGEHPEHLAVAFGVSYSAVRHIIKRRTWKHI